jgi:2-iminobutanoate/2-iminopropanoate deaminase
LFHESPQYPQGESNLIAHRISRISIAAAAFIVAACATNGIGLPWVKQAPGNTPEEGRAQREAQARGETAAPPRAAQPTTPSAPAPAAPVNARQIEVAPELVAQTPPPPRTPAQVSAATAGSATSYTQGTRYGDLVFVSGQIALDAASGQIRGTTIEEQTRQVMENLRGVLESHRLTFANVVSVTVYLKDINDFRGMNTAYDTYFRGALPARSVVAVSRIPRDALVEISVIAGR